MNPEQTVNAKLAKKPSSTRRWILLSTLGVGAGVTWWTCSNSSTRWKEEVKLSDGRVILIERTATGKRLGEIGGPGGWKEERMTLEIVSSNVQPKIPKLDSPYVPLIIDQDAGTRQWFVIASFYSCQSWYDLGRPKLPYTEFRLVEGSWVQVPLAKTRIRLPTNLLLSVRLDNVPDQTLASKELADERPTIARQYRTVVDSWTTGC